MDNMTDDNDWEESVRIVEGEKTCVKYKRIGDKIYFDTVKIIEYKGQEINSLPFAEESVNEL